MLAPSQELAADQREAMTMFRAAHRSPYTLDHNRRILGYFLNYYLDGMSADDFVNRTRQDLKWGEAKIAGYFLIVKERIERKEIVAASAYNYRKPIKILLDMNDVNLNWKRLDRILPAGRRKPAKGSAPPKDKLRMLCSYPDRRIKPIVLTMTSGGLRVGTFDYLNVGDLEPAVIDGRTVAGKLTVYRNESEEYVTRISLEAFTSMQDYFKAREQAGEHLSKDSPMIRDLWMGDRAAKGEIHIPKRLKSSGVSRLLQDAWKAFPNLRIKEGKRFNFKATHFGRRFFETACLKAGIDPWQIKIFRGDVLPTDLGYQGFSEEELTQLYLQATDELSLFENPAAKTQELDALKKRNEELSEKLGAAELEIKSDRKKLEELVERFERESRETRELRDEIRKSLAKG